MANSNKNIVITPAIGSSTVDPKIVFSGADASTGAQNITMSVYPANNGTLSIDGSAGQLFSVSNSLTGTLFAVSDISGVPSIEVLDTGVVKLAQYNGNVMIGGSTGTSTVPSTGVALWMNGTNNTAAGNRLWMDAYASSTNWLNVRTAAGTVAAPSALTAGMQIFGISAAGYGTTGYNGAGAARIRINAESAWTDTSSSTFIAFETCPTSTTAASERVRIDSNGNVGINTTSPSTFGQFSVVNGTGRFVAMSPSNGGNVAQFRFDNNGAQTVNLTNLGMTAANHGMQFSWLLGTDSVTAITAGRLGVLSEGTWTATASTQNSFMQFATATSGNITERARITSNGVLLLNLTSELSYGGFLQVGSGATCASFRSSTGTGVVKIIGAGDSYGGGEVLTIGTEGDSTSYNGIVFRFNTNGTNAIVGSVSVSSTATAYNTSSDVRLKKNIVEAPSAVEKIKALQVRSFDWKNDDSHVEHGFVAQELQTVEPLAVTEGDTWAIDPSKLVATLTKALQEALARIEALEAKLA
jgi:hypothetical protein